MKQIQWYPGHMAKMRRELQPKLKIIDLVLEVVDARVPVSSYNPVINEMIGQKPHVILLNKAHLADPALTAHYMQKWQKEGLHVIDCDLSSNYNVNKILMVCQKALAGTIAKARAKGLLANTWRMIVLGIPNTGKSTLINRLAERKSLVVQNRPGVTKKDIWVKIDNNLQMMDTPGILWPKFSSVEQAFSLALVGSIRDDILPLDEIALYGIDFLRKYYPNAFLKAYGIEISDDSNQTLKDLGIRLKAFLKGGEVDYERVIKAFLGDLRKGKLGRVSYDRY